MAVGMSRNGKIGIAVVGVVLLLVGIWAAFLRGGRATPAAPAAGSGSATARGSAGPQPTPTARPAGEAGAMPPAPVTTLDNDPDGPLTMIGQVLDEDGEGVGGAEVWVSSNPRRTTKTEADGSFTFDKLLGRTYMVGARAGDLVGGPVPTALSATSDPVVVRVRPGATLTVKVQDEQQAPLAGIVLHVAGDDALTATTGTDGKAALRGVGAGYAWVRADEQRGYAATSGGVPVPVGAQVAEVTLTMLRGVAVRGRVVDEAGQPVAGAKVSSQRAAAGWSDADGASTVTTDAKGAYEIAALPRGAWRLRGVADKFAPGLTEIFEVADAAVTVPDLVLPVGAAIAGRVVDAAGTPVPYATVRVSNGMAGVPTAGTMLRQVSADATGHFTLDGLPRSALQAMAQGEGASSKVVELDLAAVASRTDVELVLDVVGTISGVVVDSAGTPVPEVTVSAMPDFFKGAALDTMVLAGPMTASTGGGGEFTLRGLPEGDFRITAQRGTGGMMGFGMERAASAHTGATGVRVVLPTPGKLTGTLVLASGAAPSAARAHVGWTLPVPVVAGKVLVDEVDPGKYDVRFTGPEFGEFVQRDVVIEPGKTTDLGKITLPAARVLRGTVVDADGQPVEGALVSVAQFLVSSGKVDTGGGGDDDQFGGRGARTARTGADGGFAVIGLPERPMQAMAEHARGASSAIAIPAGTGDPTPVTLTLRPYGSLAGRITKGGAPMGGAQVVATPKGAAAGQMNVVMAGEDGAFLYEQIVAGTYFVQASQAGFGSTSSAVPVEVEVVAGKRAQVTIDVPVGDVELAVTVKGKGGATIGAAQVVLFRGTVAFKTGKDVMDGMTSGSSMVGANFAMGTTPVAFKDLPAAAYSVCTVPLPGDLSDPQTLMRMNEHAAEMAVYCAPVTVAAAPAKQAFTHEVPPAAPLPAP